MKASIVVRIKVSDKPVEITTIDVAYDEVLGELKMRELGDMLLRCNPDAVIEICYDCYLGVDGWKRIKTYFPFNKLLITHK